jgi:hypothetical protein
MPYVLQNADTMTSSIISTNFVMNVGGITAITSKGLTAGVSNSVGNESGLLAFTLATNTQLPAPKKGVYCVLVRTESLGFL